MNWALVVAASLGSGAVGAVVTTYGTQAKERRAARSEVRTCLRRVEQVARQPATSDGHHTQLGAALDELEGSILVAALPRKLAAFYDDARRLAYATYVTATPEERRGPESSWRISSRIAHKAAVLLADVIWHPVLTVPTRQWKLRRLQRMLDGGMPDRARMQLMLRRSGQEWDRKLLRKYLEGFPPVDDDEETDAS